MKHLIKLDKFLNNNSHLTEHNGYYGEEDEHHPDYMLDGGPYSVDELFNGIEPFLKDSTRSELEQEFNTDLSKYSKYLNNDVIIIEDDSSSYNPSRVIKCLKTLKGEDLDAYCDSDDVCSADWILFNNCIAVSYLHVAISYTYDTSAETDETVQCEYDMLIMNTEYYKGLNSITAEFIPYIKLFVKPEYITEFNNEFDGSYAEYNNPYTNINFTDSGQKSERYRKLLGVFMSILTEQQFTTYQQFIHAFKETNSTISDLFEDGTIEMLF